MRLSKQSAPLVDSYDLTVSKDELQIITDALYMLENHPNIDNKLVKKFHSVDFDDRKVQLYEDLTLYKKVKQMRSTITDIKDLNIDVGRKWGDETGV